MTKTKYLFTVATLLACLCAALGVAGLKPTVQELLDAAEASGSECVLPPGEHHVTEPLVSKVQLRGTGLCKLIWKGPETDGFLLTVVGDWDYDQGIKGVDLACRDKIGGIYLNGVHRTTIENVQVMQARGIGIQAERAWQLHVENVTVGYSRNARGFVSSPQSAGSINGLYVQHMVGDGPMIETSGCLTIGNINVEDCDAGDNPVVLFSPLNCADVAAFHFERNRGTSAIKLVGSQCSFIRGVKVMQSARGKMRVPVAVEIEGSQKCRVSGVWAPNVGEEVKIDHGSYQRGCRVE